MITDRENTFFDALLPAATATPFGDTVKIANRQFVPGLFAYVNVEAAVNNATSLRLELLASALPDLSSPVVLYDTGVVVLATFNATGRFAAALGGIGTIRQTDLYIGWRLTVAGTAPTIGGLTAGIVEAATLESLPRPTYWTGR